MLPLGIRVRIEGQEALIVARTLSGVPRYDVRLANGQLLKYAFESELEVINAGDALAPALHGLGRNRSLNGHDCA